MTCFFRQLLMLSLALVVINPLGSSAAEHAGLPNAPRVIARFHSVGFRQASPSNDATVFREIWALPASAKLRQDTLDKLAIALIKAIDANKDREQRGVRLLRPLLDDLVDAEWVLEVVEHPQDLLESAVALRLDETRSRLWQTNWSQLLDGAEPPKPIRRTFSTVANQGWFAIRSIRSSKATAGQDLLAASLFAKLRDGGAPTPASDHFLSLELDLARWAVWLGRDSGANLPLVEFSMRGRKEYVRTVGRIVFPKQALERVEKWDIPIDTIRDPLISFTAVQGAAGWLKRQPIIQQLGLDFIPNQLYFWGLSQTAFQIQGAAPVPNSAAAFKRIVEKWVPSFNPTLEAHSVGHLIVLTNRVGLVWRGLPLLVPYIDTVGSNGHEYLHGGIFPVAPSTNAAPPQLFAELTGRTNLVYYDWEITQARLAQIRSVAQLASVFLNIPPTSTNSSSFKWLEAIEPRLGNSITEVSMISSRELHFQRTSHAGLNGLELLGLATWLEGTNFPKISPRVDFRPVVPSTPKASGSKGH